ncbi:MFS general substrate transporter [Mycena kentingensis (nom. inval.)]|nr:MFS general substrate transporter [Mycena kentingensis (nom. inval.)]
MARRWSGFRREVSVLGRRWQEHARSSLQGLDTQRLLASTRASSSSELRKHALNSTIDFYTREYLSDSPPSTISWIGSVNAFIIISGGLISGRLYDRGYFYYILWGGSLLQCFSLFMLSLCKPQSVYQIFLAQGVGLGLGSGLVYIPSISVISHYFQRRRAMAMSIVASGSSLGAIIHPIMLNNLFQKLGFANAVRVSAATITAVVFIACCLMRTRLPPPAELPPFKKALRRFARDRAYIYSTAAMSFFAMGLYFVLFYIQLDAIKHDLGENFAFYSAAVYGIYLMSLLVIVNGASLIGRLSPTLFLPYLPRFGMLYCIMGSVLGATIMIFSMLALRSVASVVIIGVLYGFFAGIYITLGAPLLAFLTDDMSELGLRMGISFAFVGVGGLIGPPIQGALLTPSYIWWRPALFSGLVAFIATAFFGLMILTVRRTYTKAKVDAEGAVPAGSGSEKGG